MKSRLLGLAAVLMLLSACGTNSATRPTPSTSPSLKPGWTIVTDKAEQFSIQLPPAWWAVLRDAPNLNDQLTAMTTNNASIATYVHDQLTGTAHPHIKLVAIDPTSVGGLMITNYNVVKASLGDAGSAPNLAEVGRGELTQIKGAAQASPAPTTKTTRTPAGDAFGISYSLKLSNGQIAAVTTYVMVVDSGGKRSKYEITFGTLTPGAQTALFDQVLNSFALLH